MRIVNLKTFLSLPSGVLFSKYSDNLFGHILIKDESIATQTGDFFYYDLENLVACEHSGEIDGILEKAEVSGESFKLDINVLSRDGLFEADQLFAVWEKSELDDLRELLSVCVGADEGEHNVL
jgi:hypothetical protein